MSQKISVVGLGKAGLPLAAVIARAGFEVLGVDIDVKRCEMINNGDNPVPEEPGLSELIKEYGGKTLVAYSDAVQVASKASVHIVIVPIFIDENKDVVYTYAEQAFNNIAKGLKKGDMVILETTVPPGLTETWVRGILEGGSGLSAEKDFYLVYSPERLHTGKCISRFTEYPKVLAGYTKEAGEKAFEFYKHFVKEPQLVSNIRTAEMIKVAEGVYRDVVVALSNELSVVCNALDIDYQEMKDYANHDMCHLLNPGMGTGGHCIPVYPWFLIQLMKEKGKELPLTHTARVVNDSMVYFWRDRLLEKLKTLPKDLKDVRIAVYGINFRSGVKELSNTRTIPLIHLIEELGVQVEVTDRWHSKEEIEKLGFTYITDSEKADVLLLLNKDDFPDEQKDSRAFIVQ